MEGKRKNGEGTLKRKSMQCWACVTAILARKLRGQTEAHTEEFLLLGWWSLSLGENEAKICKDSPRAWHSTPKGLSCTGNSNSDNSPLWLSESRGAISAINQRTKEIRILGLLGTYFANFQTSLCILFRRTNLENHSKSYVSFINGRGYRNNPNDSTI